MMYIGMEHKKQRGLGRPLHCYFSFFFVIIVSVSVLIGITSSPVKSETVVNICNDAAEWPPYFYYERIKGKVNKRKVVGISIQILDKVFKMVGIKYSFTLIPWSRCQLEVENYDSMKRFEVFSDGSFSNNRASKYYITTSMYKGTTGFYYSTKKYPDGLPYKEKSDVKRFKICGVNGYNYEFDKKFFKLSPEQHIDTSARNNFIALKKVDADRCDVFITTLETIIGGEVVGKYKIPKSLKSMPIPGMKSWPYHIFISKKSPRALELLTKINQALVVLKGNGEIKKIISNYYKKLSDSK